MPPQDLTPDQLLSTTRAVRRRLDFDRPVDMALVRECLELALQAPSGSNAQNWHFVLVADADKRRAIGELYAKAFDFYRTQPFSAHALAQIETGEQRAVMDGVVSSAEHLAANMGRAPLLLIPCVTGRVDASAGPMVSLVGASMFGSILPATWSFMLAARARGLGTAWTTLHLIHEREVAEILGIPYDEVMQVALTPVAHVTGDPFRPAKRKPLEGLLHVDGW